MKINFCETETTRNNIRKRIKELNGDWNFSIDHSETETFKCIGVVRGNVSVVHLSRDALEYWKYLKNEEVGHKLIKEFGNDLKVLFK